MPLVHVDLYRLDSGAAVDDLGLEELVGGAVVAVEWAERLPRRLEGSVTVRIDDLGGDRRRISFRYSDL
jgi:tRNA threonylcarbamoyladenosine biosynthesis protein TsaE